ncbi:rab-like protein 6 isoform X2 [Rhipicephalus microplus]
MLTAFKKLVGNSGDGGGGAAGGGKHQPPSGMQAMEQSLQKRFARGVQYNMKIVIKGDRNVGKSCLLLRLQGQSFKEEYLPSDEIQVASIQWSYKATDDIVKVEVWDVVDKGKKRKPIKGLKLDNSIADAQGVPEEAALDAEFIDVYKGTNGVVMMLDITKQWTFDYVQRELPKVPANIPVLVLANHLDMKHHRNITEDQVRFYVESVERPSGSAQIRYAESSLRNGFGLRFLYKWFNLPFLQLQRESLLLQLERNSQETNATNDELDMLQESEEQNYELFVETLNNRRRQMAEQLSSASKFAEAAAATPNGLPSSVTTANLAGEAGRRPSIGAKVGPVPPRSVSVPTSLGHEAQKSAVGATLHPLQAQQQQPRVQQTQSPRKPAVSPTIELGHRIQKASPSSSSTDVASSAKASSGSAPSPTAPVGTPTKQAAGLMSKLFNKKPEREDCVVVQADVHAPPPMSSYTMAVRNVDDFVPDGDASFNSFLEERDADGGAAVPSALEEESASDEEDSGGNPLVTGFQDDVDPEDFCPGRVAGDILASAMPVSNRDSQDDEDALCGGGDFAREPSEESFLSREEISREDPDGTSSPAAPENAPTEPTTFWSMPSEDLNFLEKRYTALAPQLDTAASVPKHQQKPSGASGTTSDTHEDDAASITKKKKHKHKSKKDDTERSQKHRKERTKDKSSRDKDKGNDESGDKAKKKSHRKHRKAVEESSSDAERLEAFLGAGDDVCVERAVEAYESL